MYARPPDTSSTNRFWLVFPTPPKSRGGLASPVDAATFNVSLNGGSDDPPPRTNQEFLAYARSLEDPVISELLARATPITEPTVFRRTFAVWRHFERMTLRPAGFLPIGDAFATLNPLFGQGMSVAAKQGAALAELAVAAKSEDIAGLTDRYIERAAGEVRQAWDLGALVDSGTGWRRAFSDGEAAKQMGRLLADDPDLHRTYVAIWHLIEPATALDHGPS
jgi:flavin-dependent dehydrogenase